MDKELFKILNSMVKEQVLDPEIADQFLTDKKAEDN